MSVVKCLACHNIFQGDYCNKCGQKKIQRFTGSYLWQGLREDLFGVDRGLYLTCKELCVNPGTLVLRYIRGVTHIYYSPLKYLIFWTAIYFVLLTFKDKTGVDIFHSGELILNSNEPFSTESFHDFAVFLERFMKLNTNFYFFGIIPFLSLTAYLFYRNKNFNLMEMVILYTYFCGQFTFLVVAISIIEITASSFGIRLSQIIIFIVYYFLFFRMQMQFFKDGWTNTMVMGTGILLVGVAMYWSFAFLVFNLIKYIN